MRVADAIVVGGGPAGSTCAWKLREAGLDVLLLDRASFPRVKLCAGWVTPQALTDLELDPEDLPVGLVTFNELKLHWKMFTSNSRSRQYSIRRIEFDDFLLRRADVAVLQHKAQKIHRDGGDYVIDDEFRCRYLVGAGGTSCPVYRTFFHEGNPRSSSLQTATYEQEFAYDWKDSSCHLWFFDNGLPGYAWYVPKDNGYINVGLGGMAELLKRKDTRIREYWRRFADKLKKSGLVDYEDYHPAGYSYFLRGNGDIVCDRDAYIVGDSVGLATHDMCEGIGPAVKSGLLAANSIVSGAEYSLDEISRFSGSGWASRLIARKFTGTR